MPRTIQERRLFVSALVLMLIGLSASIYLAVLDLRIMRAGGNPVESFCAISEQVNCVTVSRSKYSFFLGVPVAFYGIEFFLLGLGILLFSKLKIWPLKAWESYLFWFSGMSIPAFIILTYISAVLIHSFCLVCLVANGVNFILFLSLLAANISGIPQMVFAGPREFWVVLKSNRAMQTIVLSLFALAVSQLAWVPPLLAIFNQRY